MKYVALFVIVVLVQGCSVYENAFVDPEIRKLRELQRINEMHAEIEFGRLEMEANYEMESRKTHDIISP